MGVEDTESDLITALYRKKYIRRKLGAVFRQLYWLHSIANFWHSLLPQPEPPAPANKFEEEEKKEKQADDLIINSWAVDDDLDDIDARDISSDSQRRIVIVAPRGRRQVSAAKRLPKGSNRDELLQRQRITMREIKLKKDEELRKEEEVVKRLVQARKKNVTEIYNDQTQRILTRKKENKFNSKQSS
ncbi:unnamed protein product [Phytophthora lilii]|uniref:Unnamed protein product n=1 Tax=Phytophthora lilii TaxID=2077276 RepID=A0A9W6U6I0_9STRA|nr:unnamed protein product [Phytophthora lilii]